MEKGFKSDKEPDVSHESGNIDSGVYTVFRERGLKISINLGTIDANDSKKDEIKKKLPCVTACEVSHYFTLFLIGVLSWGALWCAFGGGWQWGGRWCRLAAAAGAAWAAGQVLEGATGLSPLLAALATGVFARHLGFLDMRDHPEVDRFLRKIYPVVILGKGSLAWNLGYMRAEWKRVATLGVLPWTLEVLTVAACTNLLLGFPWIWGFLLGSFYCSVSCPVLMPTLVALQASAAPARNWPQLLCTAGGVDTALSVGFFGIVFSYAFYPADDTYKIIKAALTLAAGTALGAGWGWLAGSLPHREDEHAAPLRVLLVLLGGYFINYVTTLFGWSGTGGVAVLVCNATAARCWARDGPRWRLNQNPAATAYRVLWALCEPTLFACTGSYFTLDERSLDLLPIGLAILVVCLSVRLLVAAAVSWGMTLRERLVVCCLWTPKSIVEAVLCPVLLNTLILSENNPEDPRLVYAEDMVRLTVIAIVATTPAGLLLTKHAVPRLLSTAGRNPADNEATVKKYEKRNSASNSSALQNDDIYL